MSDTTSPAIDNRFANVAAQTYTDLAARVIRDEIEMAKMEAKEAERRHRMVKCSAHVLVLTIGLGLALLFVTSPVLLAVVTGTPSLVIEIIDGIFLH
jgi:hypothetical protein